MEQSGHHGHQHHQHAALRAGQVRSADTLAASTWGSSSSQQHHTARPGQSHLPTLQLPTQQLQSLRQLDLKYLRVMAADAPASPQQQQQQQQQQGQEQQEEEEEEEQEQLDRFLGAGLSLLTKLHLNWCKVSLEGLQDLSSLSSLAIILPWAQPVDSSSLEALASALPALTRLTAVVLQGPLSDQAVLQHLSALPHLQHVQLQGEVGTAALAAMPTTLTSLSLENRNYKWLDDSDSRTLLQVTRADTPHLRQLTGLQHLQLTGVGTFHPAVLAGLTGLRTLLVDCGTASREYAEPGFDVLATLTNLQLSLRCLEVQPEVITAESYAALTAPSGLTALKVMCLPAAAHSLMFPAGQFPSQLPHLAVLQCDAAVLADHACFGRLVAKCPNLRNLTLREPREAEPEDAAEQAARGFKLLASCALLTRLVVWDVPLTRAAWQDVAALPLLRDLELHDWRLSTFFHTLELTSCRSLAMLLLDGYFEDLFSCLTIKLPQADDGSPPDVRYRLPAAALREAAGLKRRSDFDASVLQFHDRITEEVSLSLATLQCEQRQQLTALQQQVAALQQEVTGVRQELQVSREAAAAAVQHDRQQMAVLQQQMRELQATVVAMQLPTMQAD